MAALTPHALMRAAPSAADLGSIVAAALDGLELSSVEAAEECVSLRLLLLSSNLLTRIEASVLRLSRLRKLDLSCNGVSALPKRDEIRGHLPSLQILYLHGNQLATLKAAGALAFLPSLLRLTLHDNPLAAHPNYRHFLVNSILPLRALDLHVISDEELIEGAHFPARFGALGDAAALPLFHQGARVAGAAEAALVRELESEIAALNAVHASLSPVLVLQNMVTAEELADDNEYQDILEDVTVCAHALSSSCVIVLFLT